MLDHYGLRSSRIHPGEAHENGVVEQAHFRTKTAVEQALLLRGHADSVDEASYETFVREVIERKRNAPAAPVPDYTTFTCVVRRWSTIRVGKRTYSVPSRLIGHTVEARQHPTVVEVRYRGHVIETIPRLRGDADHRIEYRHIIGSLVRKPGAFARSLSRGALPSLTFRQAYDALSVTHGERADVEYVRLLHLAATTRERDVETTLRALLEDRRPFDYASVQALVTPAIPQIPAIHLPVPDLAHYDALLVGGGRC